jgi:DNA-binding protein H-NS
MAGMPGTEDMTTFDDQVQRRMSDYNTLTLDDVFEFIRSVYGFVIPEGKEPGESAFNVLDYYDMEELAVVVMRAATEADRLREALNAAADEADTRRKELETILDRLIQTEKDLTFEKVQTQSLITVNDELHNKINAVSEASKKAKSVFSAAYVHEDLRLAEKYIDTAIATLDDRRHWEND